MANSGVIDTITNGYADRSSPMKRRKVRKGTQSCWECKRRKTRCTFAISEAGVCDGCRSRRVQCLPQEFYENVASRMETSKEMDVPEPIGTRSHTEGTVPPRDLQSTFPATPGINVNDPLEPGKTSPADRLGTDGLDESQTSNVMRRNGRDLNEVHRALVAAWPSEHELDLLVSLYEGTSTLSHGTVCKPYTTLLSESQEPARQLLCLPAFGSHPVLVARKLLLLATFLQGMPREAVNRSMSLKSTCAGTMSRLFNVASRLVTSRDDLVSSIEGIECIMIESMYHNNAGNLQQAWLKNRRAMSIAQVLGLDKSTSLSPLMLDASTKERVYPGYMWFRLVTTDRYLSLMLGLSQGTEIDNFVELEALAESHPLEKLERIQTAVGGLILNRNKQDLHDRQLTNDIDSKLQKAATSMPSQWWTMPDLRRDFSNPTDSLSQTIRLMNQFSFFHLLARIHLPYILHISDRPDYEHSRLTASYASREILQRFISFRSSDRCAVYCRGVDLLAFIACVTLCLIHLVTGRRHEVNTGPYTPPFHYFKHQRPSDRGLMECTLCTLMKIAEEDNDCITCRAVEVLQRLLAIEAAANEGEHCRATFITKDDMREAPKATDESDVGGVLRFEVAHIGIIQIEPAINDPAEEPGDAVGKSRTSHHAASKAERLYYKPTWSEINATVLPHGSMLSAAEDTSVAQDGEISRSAAYSEIQSAEYALTLANHEQTSMNRPVSSGEVNDHINHPLASELQAPGEIDQWFLQGVDTALFEGLFEGVESWS